jgi:hypothetical protein
LLEGDITSFFDKVSHTKLLNILRNKIKDERFLSLIYKGCKTITILPEVGSIRNRMGTLQGSILSPLLSNIYLNEFDKYMERVATKNNVGKQRRHSTEYRKVSKMLRSRKEARKLGLTPTDMMSNDYLRLSYVRYADNFIIACNCSRSEVLRIYKSLTLFLKEELGLDLDPVKSKITDTKKRPGKFLGYDILFNKGVTTRTPTNKRRLTGKGHVILKVDKRKVIESLHDKGFCKGDGTPIPKFTFLNDSQAVTNEKVNRIIRGILNYYNLADNKVQFGCHLYYLMSHSTAKLYAAKFR